MQLIASLSHGRVKVIRSLTRDKAEQIEIVDRFFTTSSRPNVIFAVECDQHDIHAISKVTVDCYEAYRKSMVTRAARCSIDELAVEMENLEYVDTLIRLFKYVPTNFFKGVVDAR